MSTLVSYFKPALVIAAGLAFILLKLASIAYTLLDYVKLTGLLALLTTFWENS